MKKACLWIGLILLSPVLLFIILTILLYVPPIQNWAVDKVAKIASENSGMQIVVDHVRLSFPLDLSIEGVKATRNNDTIADAKQLIADVKLLPLFESKVVVNELRFEKIKLNTYELLPDIQINGFFGHLSAHSRCIDLQEGTVDLNNIQLNDADVAIILSDTAAVDTTQSKPVPWSLAIDSLSILRTRVEVHMPGDSMQITIGMQHAKAIGGNIELLRSAYAIQHFSCSEGVFSYHLSNQMPTNKGMDFNYIDISKITLAIDSIYFTPSGAGMKIRNASLREKSGMEVRQLAGSVMMDSLRLRIPRLFLSTPFSSLTTKAVVDFNVADSIQPGQTNVQLDASLGKNDLLLFMTEMPKSFCQKWPDWPLAVKATVNGNLQNATIKELELSLPTAFRAKTRGTFLNLSNTDSLAANVSFDAESYDISFFTSLFSPTLLKDFCIPNGMKLNGTATVDGTRYMTNLTLQEGSGTVKMKGWLSENTMSYDADLQIENLNLHHFLPNEVLYQLNMCGSVKGQGTDFFKKNSWLEADLQLSHLRYSHLNVDSIKAHAQLKEARAKASITGINDFLHGRLNAEALLRDKSLLATLSADLQKLDLRALQVADKELNIGMCGHIDFQSDFTETYKVSGLIGEIYIKDSLNLYRPEDVGLTIRTQPDTTLLRMQSGDLIVKADASGGYKLLLDRITDLSDSILSQFKERTFRQPVIKSMLPTTRFYVTSGQNNPLANFLRSSANTYFKDLNINLTTSAERGINGGMHVFSLNADSTRIDTIRMDFKDSNHGLTFQGQVTNNRRNPQFIFNALFDGHFHESGAVAGMRYYDENNQLGLRLGASASVEHHGIRIKLLPERPTLGYREFTLNKNNYLYFGRDLKIQADIHLMDNDGSGIKIYSENQDSTLLQDLTVSLNHFDLDKMTSVIPYVPHITGILDGDFHLLTDQKQNISVSSDMKVAKMSYENSYIGNVSTEFVYIQREDDTHALQAAMMLEDRNIMDINGSYQNQGPGYLDLLLSMHHTPMNIVNGFVPDQIVGLEGYAEGELAVKGTTVHPQVDGEVLLDSAYLISIPYGMRLRFDDDPVRIVNSKLLLENFTMYAYNKNPLNIMGNIDFQDTNHLSMSLRMRAQNFQLINSKQTKESIAFGKAFVNVFASLGGPLSQLRMRGRLDVLGTTDLTYLLLDSPISSDNRLDELVKFTDFTDSTQTVVQRPQPEGLSMNLTISIDEAAHVLCGLNADRSNYVDLYGGGDLNLKYDNSDISLTGRYTLTSGSMKYSLPIIPLKRFTIQDGSYIEFTGNMMNPRLNITATERTKATVGQEGGQSRSVDFDCGVVITKTLQNMGLEFIIDAPEDMTISSELNTMSAEQRGKLSVSMLTTGMYMADNNTQGLSVNSALNTFLQNEINSITGHALKTADLSVGLDNTTDATGQMRTDYSFKFAKRFWNNRLKVQIGGKVSSNDEVEGQKQNFFDNVSMEYRLSPTSNQYVKLFYKQNVYDWLDGYTGEYGGGYIYRRKLNSLIDIFRLWGKDQRVVMPRQSMHKSVIRRDSTRTEGTNHERVIKADSIPTGTTNNLQ